MNRGSRIGCHASRTGRRTAWSRQGVSRGLRQTRLVRSPSDLRELELKGLKRGSRRRCSGEARIRKAEDAMLIAGAIGPIGRRDRGPLAIVSAQLDRKLRVAAAGRRVEYYDRGKDLDDERVGDDDRDKRAYGRPPRQAIAKNRLPSHPGTTLRPRRGCGKPSCRTLRRPAVAASLHTLGMILSAGNHSPSRVGGQGIASSWSNTT